MTQDSADGPPPEVSVVMPARNAGRFIDEAIASILAQSFTDFELIICDDNSTDDTPEKIAEWAKRDPRIRTFWSDQHNSPARAGNWCVSLARARFVARIDADDVAHPERLQKQIAVLRSDPSLALVGCLFDGIDSNSRPIYPRDRTTLTSTRINSPCGHTVAMFRKSAFDRIGGYRIECDYWEDFDLIHRLSTAGRIVYLPDRLQSYRHSNGHARVRAEDQIKIERALDLSFDCKTQLAEHGEYETLLPRALEALQTRRRFHLRVFSTLASLRVTAGDRPRIWRRLISRGRFATFKSDPWVLPFLVWGTIWPKSLRWVRGKMKARADRAVADRFTDGVPVEWHWSKKRAAARDAASDGD